ncbi:MAG: OmpH family outer membrane protein [Candidatus Omnitrophica bacterium]|nr:OmpH family outer membrane protein [Candidatus Omnitrophota bacterium]
MKKLSLMAVVVLGLFLVSGMAYAEEKYTYVDLGKVFDEYKKTKEYDKVLEAKQKDFEKKRETMVGGVKELQEKMSLLSEEEREARKGELEDKIAKLQEFDRNETQDLRKQRDEKVQEIFKDIKGSIDNYSKKQGISLVFDQRALVFHLEQMDITEAILSDLNKGKN